MLSPHLIHISFFQYIIVPEFISDYMVISLQFLEEIKGINLISLVIIRWL